MRFGLLSTALINEKVLRGAAGSETVSVVAVGSRDGARATAYTREHGLERGHGSYEALLADPDVDAVYISLPNGLHHEWTLRSLAAGKHVLCEKPYTRHPGEVEEAFDAAVRAAGQLQHMPGRHVGRQAPLGPLRLWSGRGGAISTPRLGYGTRLWYRRVLREGGNGQAG